MKTTYKINITVDCEDKAAMSSVSSTASKYLNSEKTAGNILGAVILNRVSDVPEITEITYETIA